MMRIVRLCIQLWWAVAYILRRESCPYTLDSGQDCFSKMYLRKRTRTLMKNSVQQKRGSTIQMPTFKWTGKTKQVIVVYLSVERYLKQILIFYVDCSVNVHIFIVPNLSSWLKLDRNTELMIPKKRFWAMLASREEMVCFPLLKQIFKWKRTFSEFIHIVKSQIESFSQRHQDTKF